ncbi:uncharacterized protein I206_101365 [Kwoniella pini CBS 10737]|uniref:Uncharacterized protein n=1 Tax=Kwoniella pini CBS 10737 TaxID=1296096 RepID=A0A1B9HWW5_9TREE|nr:uncharacterized protein I206_06666 [Kwoniella pini CBS 10737]OCF47759.1 hypothetical protein I206_06666 [Kwoniella pini CBS 10737]
MTSRSPSPQGMIPRYPNGLFSFDEGCVLVEDADVEIMELYMSLASTSPEIKSQDKDSGGLGFLSSNDSILNINIDLTPPVLPTSEATAVSDGNKRGMKKKAKISSGGESKKIVESVNVQIQQDLGMLKGRGGDTGSVLWRSSLYLSTQILRQSTYPDSYVNPIFHSEVLKKSSILELGAGTGLLSILLSGHCKKYTSSDRLENLKLVKRNLELNGINIGDRPSSDTLISNNFQKRTKLNGSSKNKFNPAEEKRYINLEEIDWTSISDQRKRHPELWISDFYMKNNKEEEEESDLILAVDCIYNEFLIQPLIDTLGRYCKSGEKSVVWVVVELRSADVLTMFLEKWMNDSSGPWTIIRLSEKMMGDWEGKKARWVGWVGWR